MKWSPFLHTIAWVAGVLGLLALVGAWIAGQGGEFIGLSEEHLFNDTMALSLVSIAFGIGTMIHRQQE